MGVVVVRLNQKNGHGCTKRPRSNVGKKEGYATWLKKSPFAHLKFSTRFYGFFIFNFSITP